MKIKIFMIFAAFTAITNSLVSSYVSDAQLHAQRMEQQLRESVEFAHQIELVRELLKKKDKFNINATDRFGQTALHIAEAYLQYDIMKLLLQNGADPNIEDADGNTAVDSLDDKETLRLLFKLNVLNSKNKLKLADRVESKEEKEAKKIDELKKKPVKDLMNKLKELIIDNQILSYTYNNFDFPWKKPRKYKNYSLQSLHDQIGETAAQAKLIQSVLSEEQIEEVNKNASKVLQFSRDVIEDSINL